MILSIGEAVFSTGRLVSVGALDYLLIEESPISTGNRDGEEITEKKTAEEAVRASEERLRLAQQVARVGSFERNLRAGVVTWSPVWSRSMV